MSSDYYFDDVEHMDSAFFDALDAIEATHTASQKRFPSPQLAVGVSNSFYSTALPSTFKQTVVPAKPTSFDPPVAGPSKIVQPEPIDDSLPRPPHLQLQSKPASRSFGKKAQKVKKWDHTAFAKSGWTKPKNSKGKEKAKAISADADADDDFLSVDEFEQFPAPLPKSTPPPPFKQKPDLLAAQTWIYPTNKPKRDYQFNIVRDSLFENSLVALPTGLGKTFIAGVIMLNYYRWFPEGKVVFVAPTKPLVAQQIDACHQICGIPGGDAAELTGQVSRQARARAWQEKRVFFMTPQTFMNDLKSDNCKPTDIVLLVIDEAHKATGDYAYSQLVRYLMATNGHFRVLALTATPGSKPEAVQAIVDSLHISNIEIRDESSLDLRSYMLPKKISTHIVKMNPEVIRVRDMLVKLMTNTAKRLLETGLMPNIDFIKLHPYRCTKLMQDSSINGNGKKFPWLFSVLKKLAALARAMGYLLECSTRMCYEELHGLASGVDRDGKKAVNLRTDPLLQDIIKELERQHNAGLTIHPKMDKLQMLAVDYFAQANADVEETAQNSPPDVESAPSGQTKMMVFSNFRLAVEEIVEVLNKHHPMIRATRFIGQGVDKHGKKGIAQKDQLEVIKRFKNGDYNALVATSIGEEGLDIGEVDAIVCYDAQKAPIRMLQRIGRTGRRREGRVDVLMCEGREESNWDNAKNEYENVQRSILRGDSLELYADVDRLLPDHIKPKCLETFMVIEEYIRDAHPAKSSTTVANKGKKRKRDNDVMRNIPEGAVDGFVASSRLILKSNSSKKRKVDFPSLDPKALESDDDDRDIEAGIHAIPPSNLVDKGLGKSMPKSKLNSKVSSMVNKFRAKKTSPATTESILTRLDHQLADDSDDIEIELGIDFSPTRDIPASRKVALQSSSSFDYSGHISFNEAITELRNPPPAPRPLQQPNPREDNSWLLDSDDGEGNVVHSDDDVRVIEDVAPRSHNRFSPLILSSPENAGVHSKALQSKSDMVLSPVPIKSPSQASSSMAFPDPTFPIRPLKARRKRAIALSPSPKLNIQPRRLHTERFRTSPLPRINGLGHRSNPVDPCIIKEFLDLEAEVSGDDGIHLHSSSDGEGVESESDRRFLEELDPTQAVLNYDQSNAYRHSLMTQPPIDSNVPLFASKPTRRTAFGPMKQESLMGVSSSPLRDTSDQYSVDSFVVADDDDVLSL
ncbi:hypothetical protein BU17DRAFT_73555 [Hysterangium stoloniferum]|nr:hypothetical protein BU17DRAFT_73555 [Hysterangium stoloniferum]